MESELSDHELERLALEFSRHPSGKFKSFEAFIAFSRSADQIRRAGKENQFPSAVHPLRHAP